MRIYSLILLAFLGISGIAYAADNNKCESIMKDEFRSYSEHVRKSNPHISTRSQLVDYQKIKLPAVRAGDTLYPDQTLILGKHMTADDVDNIAFIVAKLRTEKAGCTAATLEKLYPKLRIGSEMTVFPEKAEQKQNKTK
jgi:hypothetical protein